MARQHGTEADFQAVGMSKDPTPGDPQLIQGVLQRYADIGDAAEKALNVLKKDGAVSTGRGSAMDKLREKIGDDLPEKLTKTATSYHDAAEAYRGYIPRLQEAQDTFDRAVQQAQSAAPAANQAPPTLAPDATDEDKAAATKAQDAIDAGQGQLSAAKSLAEQALAMRETAQRTAADVLDRAASEAIPERNIFQKISDFFKDFPFVQILLGLLIAVVSVFFPVAGLLLGGALFALTQISAIASGNFKLGDFLVGLLTLVPGASVLKLGGGVLKVGAGAIGKIAPAAAKTVKASITTIKTTLNSSKSIGPLINSTGGKFAGAGLKGFGEKAGDELTTEALNGDELNAGQIFGAGAAGIVGGGIAKKFGPEPKAKPDQSSRALEPRNAAGPDGTTGAHPPTPDAANPSAQLDPRVNQNAITGIPAGESLQFRTDGNTLFRDDRRFPLAVTNSPDPARLPDQPGVFNTGFEPRDPSNTHLGSHVDGNESGFVSTTRNETLNFLGGPGPNQPFVFRFHIQAPGGVDVNASLGSHNTVFQEAQQEVAFPGGIRPENIIGANRITGGGRSFEPVRVGPFVPNPNFQPQTANPHFPIPQTAANLPPQGPPPTGPLPPPPGPAPTGPLPPPPGLPPAGPLPPRPIPSRLLPPRLPPPSLPPPPPPPA
jgi:hypothetical protein